MAQADSYKMNLLKVNAACCMHNYKQFGRLTYLLRSISYTREALKLHTKERNQHGTRN